MLTLISEPYMAEMAYGTLMYLIATYHQSQIAMWVLKKDAPERITGIWWLAQANGILPRHLADELVEWLRPIYKGDNT